MTTQTPTTPPDLIEVTDIPTIGNADGWSIIKGSPTDEILLNLGDGSDFSMAVEIVEDQILDAFTVANDLDSQGREVEARQTVDRLLEYVTTIPQKVMAGVLLSMGDLSARAFMRLRELEEESL